MIFLFQFFLVFKKKFFFLKNVLLKHNMVIYNNIEKELSSAPLAVIVAPSRQETLVYLRLASPARTSPGLLLERGEGGF